MSEHLSYECSQNERKRLTRIESITNKNNEEDTVKLRTPVTSSDPELLLLVDKEVTETATKQKTSSGKYYVAFCSTMNSAPHLPMRSIGGIMREIQLYNSGGIPLMKISDAKDPPLEGKQAEADVTLLGKPIHDEADGVMIIEEHPNNVLDRSEWKQAEADLTLLGKPIHDDADGVWIFEEKPKLSNPFTRNKVREIRIKNNKKMKKYFDQNPVEYCEVNVDSVSAHYLNFVTAHNRIVERFSELLDPGQTIII